MFVHIFPFINYVKYCILSYYRYNYEKSYKSFTTIRIMCTVCDTTEILIKFLDKQGHKGGFTFAS